MNIAETFINKSVTSWLLTTILFIGGIVSFQSLGRLEDPEFTIKDAQVITFYPGASPTQVEEEVTHPLEIVIQELSYVDKITSISKNGFSQISVSMKNIYGKDELPQIWDELRRKVSDYTTNLPPGVSKPIVNDDYGDVFGILLMIYGNDYSYQELSDYVDYLKRELVLIEGVGKVFTAGEQTEQVFVEISKNKLSQLGIPINRIFDLLSTQNVVSNAGKIKVGSEHIRIFPTGEFDDINELEQLIISGTESEKLIYLGDVAKISRGYEEVPRNILHYNGNQALGLGISFASGSNVVDVGVAIKEKLEEIEYQRPLGIEIKPMYNQPLEVTASVKSFVVNFIEAVAIVIVVLLLFMGLRSGLLIGLILVLTVLGTFIFMKIYAIDLQRISLGALIIALGMLVDNAIVVTEGILIGLKKGLNVMQAAGNIVKQTIWPLLGATIIAILAFAPIGLSNDSTGEFAGTLFYVLLISLLLSWVTAITLTPFFANIFFKNQQTTSDEMEADPYKGVFFVVYKKLLTLCLNHRYFTMLLMVGLMVTAFYGFGYVRQSFFPPSTTPIFLMDYWKAEGTHIEEVEKDITAIESFLLEQDNINFVSSSIGNGFPRFMLTYTPEKPSSSYGQVLVRVNDYKQINADMEALSNHIATNHPDSQIKFKPIMIGPSPDGKIEARFSGSDPEVLRSLSVQTKEIFHNDYNTTNIRDDWREKIKVIRPQFNETQARRVGISKQDLDEALLLNATGKQVGIYRDGTTLLPIITRPPDSERLNVDGLTEIQIWSPIYNTYIPIKQVVDEFETSWENATINRLDKKRTITVMTDPSIFSDETADTLLKRVMDKVEALDLPTGYALEWGGEYESSNDGRSAIFVSLPLGFLTMFIITMLLFNSLRQPLIIWSCVPLAIIGVSSGLLLLNADFGFMALLGFLSLSGMLIKNGIVLVDQINIDMSAGKTPLQAVFDSAVSRSRPVLMAAITTMLGMIPLLIDDFFKSMAVVIIFGLGFASVLTLIVIPVLYTIAFKIDTKAI